jgi:hypothetical protein
VNHYLLALNIVKAKRAMIFYEGISVWLIWNQLLIIEMDTDIYYTWPFAYLKSVWMDGQAG